MPSRLLLLLPLCFVWPNSLLRVDDGGGDGEVDDDGGDGDIERWRGESPFSPIKFSV